MFLARIFIFLENICVWGSVISLLTIMGLTTFDVLVRKIFDYSIPSLYEFTEDYLMVGLVFLSLSYVYQRGGHVRVTLFLKFIPRPVQGGLDKILDFFALVLFLLIMVKGWENTVRAFQFSEVSSSLLAYPLAPALLLVPLGSALLCIRIAHSIILSVLGKNSDNKTLPREMHVH